MVIKNFWDRVFPPEHNEIDFELLIKKKEKYDYRCKQCKKFLSKKKMYIAFPIDYRKVNEKYGLHFECIDKYFEEII